MAFAIDGLASGLDTTSLITSLMRLEAVPQTLLKQRAAGTQSVVSALQTLNSRVATLATTASTAAGPTALQTFTATASTAAITASAGTGSSAGSIEVTVDRLAQRHALVSDPVAQWDATDITITDALGVPTTVTAASTSLDDVIEAVNTSGTGVTATKVAAGGQFRLQFASTTTGAEAAFTVTGSGIALTEVSTAQDAQVRLWAGTGAEQAMTAPTNRFAALLPGLDVTVNQTSGAPVTLTVSADHAAARRVAGGLVESVAAVLSHITANSAVAVPNGSAGSASGAAPRAGLLTGDSAVRDIRNGLVAAVMDPVAGRSPSEIGISITRDGVLQFDEQRFDAARDADPAGTAQMFATIAARVEAQATAISDPVDGALTAKIAGRQAFADSLGKQIESWETRLDRRRATLERTYAALEVAMSNLNSQSNWLSSQLAGMSPGAKS